MKLYRLEDERVINIDKIINIIPYEDAEGTILKYTIQLQGGVMIKDVSFHDFDQLMRLSDIIQQHDYQYNMHPKIQLQ